MLDEAVVAIIERFNLPLAGQVVPNPADDRGLLIPLYLSKDASGRQNPSGKTLAQLRAALAEVALQAEFLLINRASEQMEEGLRSSLIGSFPNLVRTSYLSVAGGVAHVWVEKKKELSKNDIQAMTDHILRYANLFRIERAELKVTSDFDVATPTEVLRAVRKLAPATCEEVCGELETKGYAVPSLQWVNHRFDLLRKNELIVRMNNRTYALTSKALHQLGTIKDGRSPDIGRLLALARREA
jgi:hypothetical protein